ncbi:RNA polymerase sigma24 factor [Actinomadura cremea]|nr:RNA polymerase sigma24 factor [Actinomadura cremea]
MSHSSCAAPLTGMEATGITAHGTATRVFADHRELLFSVVYNLLGSVADTEDVLQDARLAWASRDRPEVAAPRAYLVRVAVNAALARQAAISRRRETYIGPWLPDPLIAGADESAERTEAVSMALLVVLETLTPLERAVFVLHEVFGYPHPEIAAILDRTPSAVRQLAHRARAHVHARRPRFPADPHVRRQATERFLRAALGGDLGTLLEILAPDVTLWMDANGRPGSPLRPIHGRDRVARTLAATVPRRVREIDDLDIDYRTVNGDPSAVLFAGDAPFAVMVLDLDGDRVTGIYTVTNPDRLPDAD